jgi:hypothetical protein
MISLIWVDPTKLYDSIFCACSGGAPYWLARSNGDAVRMTPDRGNSGPVKRGLTTPWKCLRTVADAQDTLG